MTTCDAVPVLIIGAGPAGLTAAYELVKLGIASRRPGEGRAGRRNRPHRAARRLPLRHRRPSLLHQSAGGRTLLARGTRRRTSSGSPASPGSSTTGSSSIIRSNYATRWPTWASARAFCILLSYLRWKAFPYPVEETFEQWVTNRFGRRLYRTFFRTYTEKVWGIPCTQIRADWAAQRIRGMSLRAAVWAALTGQHDTSTLIKEFHYPRLGPGHDVGARPRDRR